MSILSKSAAVSQSNTDVYAVPPDKDALISNVRIISSAKTVVTIFRYQALDKTLYPILSNHELDKDQIYTFGGINLNPYDKIVAVSSALGTVVHVFGTETPFS